MVCCVCGLVLGSEGFLVGCGVPEVAVVLAGGDFDFVVCELVVVFYLGAVYFYASDV